MEFLLEKFENLNIEKPLTELNNPSIPKMTQQFKPEYLNCIPEFDGNPNELSRYLSTSESLIQTFYDIQNPNNFQNTYLLNSIISKLKGNAKVIANIQTIISWQQLKDVLTRNFADQRDEACLNRDLIMLRQEQNEKPQKFFDRCLNVLNLLCSYVDVHENTVEAKTLKRNLYQDLTLKTFLSGLKEPLGTTIRCMKPTNLSEALQYVIREDNIHYFQNYTNKNLVRPQIQTNQFRPQHKPFVRQNFHQNSHFNTNSNPNYQDNRHGQNSFPSQPINIRPNQNFQQPRFYTNAQVFKQPQNKNVFRRNPNQTFPRPTPMSTSTRNTNFSRQNETPMSISTSNTNQNFNNTQLYNTEITEDENPQNYNEEVFEYDDQPCEFDNSNLENLQDELNEENFLELPQTYLNS